MKKEIYRDKFARKTQNMINKDFFIYFIFYTFFFAVLFLLSFNEFIFQNGKSFIWYYDGVKQHFPFLLDLSSILKEQILKGNFQFWSWEIGLGADVIQSYSYYNIGDPLSILTALIFSKENLEAGYSIMTAVRIYLVGLSLLYYLKHMGVKLLPSVTASLMFAFSTQIIFWGIRHPFFSNAAILLPLFFLSVEKIFKDKRGSLFILCVALSAISNFYFFYMNTLAVFIYALVRFFYFVQEDRLSSFIKLFAKVCMYYLIGIGIGAVLFIPSAYGFLNTARTSPDIPENLIFSLGKYKDIIAQLIKLDYDLKVRITLAAVVLPCIILFFIVKNNKLKSFKILFIIHTIFLCLPIMYSVFNGFSSANNRWLYMYVLYMCIITAFTMNHKEKIRTKHLVLTTISLIIYFIIIHEYIDLNEVRVFLIPLFCIICFMTLYFLNNVIIKNIKGKNKIIVWIREYGVDSMVLLLVLLNIIGNTSVLMLEKNYGSEFYSKDTVYDEYKFDKTAVNIKDDSFYRIDYYDDERNNKSIVNNFKGTHLYNSIIDKHIIDFYRFNNLGTKESSLVYKGMDDITPLNTLLGIKYYISKNSQEPLYGYDLIDKQDDYSIYRNENHLPVGFVYNNYILKENLNNMEAISRIYNMVEGVIAEEKIPGIHEIQPRKYEENIEYEIIHSSGVRLENHKLTTEMENAQITFKLKDTDNKEVYMCLNRIQFEDPSQKFKVTVKTDNIKKDIETRGENNNYYEDNRDYLYNLGYYKEEELIVEVSFSNPGEYSFTELSFYGVDMAYPMSQINELKENSLIVSEYDNNSLRGNINLQKDGVLFLSIPYTKGWKIEVDGQDREAINANSGFMGVYLEKGYHEISLNYTTPYLIPSLIITVISIGIFVFYIIRNRKV